MKKETRIGTVGLILLSYVISVAFCMNYEVCAITHWAFFTDNIGVLLPTLTEPFYTIINTISESFGAVEDRFTIMTLVGVAVFFILKKFAEYLRGYIVAPNSILCALLALAGVAGKSIYLCGGFDLMYCSIAQVLKSIMLFVAYYTVYKFIYNVFYDFLHSSQRLNKLGCKSKDFFDGSKKLKPIGVIAIVWLVHILIKYPAGICPDAMDQIYMTLGDLEYTSHHPIVSTLFYGAFVKFGGLLGSYVFGAFLAALVQQAFALYVVYELFDFFREIKTPYLMRKITFLVIILAPYFTDYVGTLLKDVMYTYSMLLFMIYMARLLVHKEKFLASAKNGILLALGAVIAMLFRNNGIYVIAPTLLAVCIYIIVCGVKHCTERKLKIASVFGALALLILPVAAASSINSGLNALYNVKPGSSAEMLSVPFQQTARYVRDYSDEVTEEEAAVIDKVLDYENLAELYNPRISDPVKNTYKESENESQNLKEYLGVWFKQFLKHPGCYIEATANSIYSLFCPTVENQGEVYLFFNFYDANGYFEQPNIFALFKYLELGYTILFHALPIVSLFSNAGFYVVLFLLMLAYGMKDKHRGLLMLALPLLLTLAVAIVSPVILDHPRYVFPIVYAMPLYIAMFLHKSSVTADVEVIAKDSEEKSE